MLDLSSMLGILKSANNPMSMMQQIASMDPRMQQVMKVIQDNGGDAKTAFYRVAEQKGVNPDDILNVVKKMM